MEKAQTWSSHRLPTLTKFIDFISDKKRSRSRSPEERNKKRVRSSRSPPSFRRDNRGERESERVPGPSLDPERRGGRHRGGDERGDRYGQRGDRGLSGLSGRTEDDKHRGRRIGYRRPKGEEGDSSEAFLADLPLPVRDDPVPESKIKWGKQEDEEPEEEIEKEKPDFKPSGLLTMDLKTRKGVELIYTECEEGRIPTTKWRLYPMKDNAVLVCKKSYYLLGRDRKVVDIPLDHPSCSKQHAVIQFRMISKEDPETLVMKRMNRPYIMDLGATNGTTLNGTKIDSMRYVELFEKDVLKFGNSSREFVLLHEGSK